MPSRRAARTGPDAQPPARDRWRRRILFGQGIYYVVTGLWPLLHFRSFARAVALEITLFQAQAFAAVIIVVGASLLEAARRQPPGAFPTLLGAAVAGAIALVDLAWLPRLGVASALWLDLAAELALAIALGLLYPRGPAQAARAPARRR